MFNPLDYSLTFQKAALRGSQEATRLMTASLVRMLKQQEHLLHGRAHRRADDTRTRPPATPRGADLQNHYGRRCHDIDVEHI